MSEPTYNLALTNQELIHLLTCVRASWPTCRQEERLYDSLLRKGEALAAQTDDAKVAQAVRGGRYSRVGADASGLTPDERAAQRKAERISKLATGEDILQALGLMDSMGRAIPPAAGQQAPNAAGAIGHSHPLPENHPQCRPEGGKER